MENANFFDLGVLILAIPFALGLAAFNSVDVATEGKLYNGGYSSPEKEISQSCNGFIGYRSAYDGNMSELRGIKLLIKDGKIESTEGEPSFRSTHGSSIGLLDMNGFSDGYHSILSSNVVIGNVPILEYTRDQYGKQFCAIYDALKDEKIAFNSRGQNFYYFDTSKPFSSTGSIKNKHLIIYDERNDAVMASILLHTNYNETLGDATQRIFSSIVSQAKNEVDRIRIEDFKALIPPLPNKPEKPTPVNLVKSQFETSQAFAQRVESVRMSEKERIEKAAQTYIELMEKRNQEIVRLDEEYSKAIIIQAKENQRVVDWLGVNQADIKLWIVNSLAIRRPEVRGDKEDDYFYDADKGELHGMQNGFPFVMPLNSVEARYLIDYNNFERTSVDAVKEGNDVVIKGMYGVYHNGIKRQFFHTTYKSAGPKHIEAVVVPTEVKIPKIDASLAQFKAVIPTVDTVWETSSVAVVADLYNPKAPTWFSSPQINGDVGYGSGLTLEDAKNDALRELALKCNLSVSVEQSTTTTATRYSVSEDTMKKKVDVSTSKPYTGSFKIVHQEHMDGRWYVQVNK